MNPYPGEQILLVEDDPLDRMLTARALAELDLGMEIVSLADGQELLDHLRHHDRVARPIRLVLMDLKMPRVDGLGVLSALAGDPLVEEVPFVVMSSSSLPQDVAHAYALRARAFLVKPITLAEFREVVRGVGLFWGKYNRLPVA